jgi:predicted transcriptional regulator
MKASEIMSTPIVFTKGNVKLTYVKDLFTRNNISAPVLNDNGDIEGIISSSDLIANHNESLLVSDVMSTRVHVCALNARLKDIAIKMTTEKIHHMVAMDDGKIHGMISSLDVIKGLLEEI